jgi:hypothetical protein
MEGGEMTASDSAFAIAMLCFIAAYLVGDSQGIVVWKAVGTFWIAVHLVRKWKEA